MLGRWRSVMSAQDTQQPLAPVLSSAGRLFPTLTDAQIARIASVGRRRAITRGEVLVEVGDRVVPVFVVLSGEIQVLRPADGAETLVVVHHAHQFSGEVNM